MGLVPENELSKSAGVILSKITGGPLVNESMETNIEGIFSCGNALHVHDLVDNVSAESSNAGRKAAIYVKNDKRYGEYIKVSGVSGVRYTVPSLINSSKVDKSITIRFRVGEVFKESYISLYFDETRIMHIKKQILAPGEMEELKISKVIFDKYPNCKEIIVKIDKE